jgi:hypothetical protein
MKKIYNHKQEAVWSRAVSMAVAAFVAGMLIGGIIILSVVLPLHLYR